MKKSIHDITMSALQTFENVRTELHQKAHDRYQSRLTQIQADYAAETRAIDEAFGVDTPAHEPAPTGTLLSASVEEGHYD